MEKIKSYLVIVFIFAIITISSLVLSHMALLDIYHAETDVTIEWTMVRISFVIFWAFTILTMITIVKIFKSDLFKEKTEHKKISE